MNEKQADNLRILIRHMEAKVSRTLDMDKFFEPCGTPACAYGEACMVPEFQAQGLRPAPCPAYGFKPSVSRELGLFGQAVTLRLFGAGCSNAWGRGKVTPQEWAIEARKVLAEKGYSMDAPKPAPTFKAFMAKVLEPVEA